MKLQLTTILYFISNILFITFRTVQILCFTEKDTAFLMPRYMPVTIAFCAIGVVLLCTIFINALYKPRMPKDIKAKTVPSLAVSAVSGVLYAVSGILYTINVKSVSFFLIVSITSALACILYGFTEFFEYEFPRFATLILIIAWIYNFITSYIFYSTKPLRFRTILETLAIALVTLFFISFGKLKSGVKQNRNIRLLYPLGLIASTLCFVSLVPETIAAMLGGSAKITESCISQTALLSAGIFTAFISLGCFKRQPKGQAEELLELTEEEMPFYMEPVENFKVVNVNVDVDNKE